MDVAERSRFTAGFTLIESVVALGLFAGAVFLLVTVFGQFSLDNFPSQTHRALAVAQEQITSMERDRNFTSSTRDTMGFRITQSAGLQYGLVRLVVTVASRNKPVRTYAQLTALCRSK